MPNILKKFSPKLTGYSTGSNVIFTPNKNAALNEAISGRKANDIPSQVERLISDLKMLKINEKLKSSKPSSISFYCNCALLFTEDVNMIK